MDTISNFLAIEKQYEDKLPPVHLWSPKLNGDLDMRVDREGRWFYQGDLIRREGLVKLFSSIIKQENNDYYLVTPVEKWRIKVDVAPLHIIAARRVEDEVLFTTNVGNEFPVCGEHPIEIQIDAKGNPLPLVKAQRQLDALIARPVYYQLIEWSHIKTAPEGGDVMVLISRDQEFILGEC